MERRMLRVVERSTYHCQNCGCPNRNQRTCDRHLLDWLYRLVEILNEEDIEEDDNLYDDLRDDYAPSDGDEYFGDEPEEISADEDLSGDDSAEEGYDLNDYNGSCSEDD